MARATPPPGVPPLLLEGVRLGPVFGPVLGLKRSAHAVRAWGSLLSARGRPPVKRAESRRPATKISSLFFFSYRVRERANGPNKSHYLKSTRANDILQLVLMYVRLHPSIRQKKGRSLPSGGAIAHD